MNIVHKQGARYTVCGLPTIAATTTKRWSYVTCDECKSYQQPAKDRDFTDHDLMRDEPRDGRDL